MLYHSINKNKGCLYDYTPLFIDKDVYSHIVYIIIRTNSLVLWIAIQNNKCEVRDNTKNMQGGPLHIPSLT